MLVDLVTDFKDEAVGCPACLSPPGPRARFRAPVCTLHPIPFQRKEREHGSPDPSGSRGRGSCVVRLPRRGLAAQPGVYLARGCDRVQPGGWWCLRRDRMTHR